MFINFSKRSVSGPTVNKETGQEPKREASPSAWAQENRSLTEKLLEAGAFLVLAVNCGLHTSPQLK